MVLEQIVKARWLERKEHSFFIGFAYALIGTLSAKLIFGASVDLMSIAFTSLLLIPSIAMLLRIEENLEIREKKLSLPLIWRDHKDIFKVYISLFLGIFLAYSLMALLLPQQTAAQMFYTQLDTAGIPPRLTGHAFDIHQLTGYIINNSIVFIACFILSIFYGAGSILFLTWNASVWGVVFGYIARQSSASAGSLSPLTQFFLIILPILPHMVTEALAYVSASIVGGVVSKATLREQLFSDKFKHIMTDALILLCIGLLLVVVAAVIESTVF